MEDYRDIILNIRAIANGLPPQKDISKLLYKHGCTYLLSKCLPPKIADSYICFNKMATNEKYSICAPVFNFLDKNNIKFVVMKGAVLSQIAYGNFAIRKSNDIDLFINGTCVDKAKNYISSLGFIQGRVTSEGIVPFNRRELIFYASQSHQVAPFVKQINSPLVKYVNLDINTSLLWGESTQCFDAEFALSHQEEITICDIPVKKFSLELEFIALCLHHYKDMNSIYLLYNGSLKLNLFCDIYFYITNNKINFLQIKEICDQYQIKGFIYYCIYYTNEVFGGLETYLELFFDMNTYNHINQFGLDEAQGKKWSCSFYQRLFRPDFKEYFCSLLSENDILKIKYNQLYL